MRFSRDDLVRELPAMTTAYDVRRADWLIVFLATVYLMITRASVEYCFLILFGIAAGGIFAVRRMGLRKSIAILIFLVVVLGFINSRRSIRELRSVTIGSYSGIATVISDPRNVGAATRITLEIESDRFSVYAYGRPGWRLAGVKVGEQIFVSGQREELEPDNQQWLIAEHIKGRFEVDTVGEVRLPAAPLMRSVQRVRDLVSRGADSFEFADRTLFTGLVIGDDTRQPKSMIVAFRDSGLAHLVAVSGQNVAFILAVMSPLLSRLTRRPRMLVTFGILAWFVVITRVEPSVVRAAMMAGLAFLSVAIGRPTRTMRLIALTVLIAVMVDPLLAWSVGFYMSVGATCGLCLGAGPLARNIRGPKWLAQLIAATVAAQIGVMPAVLLVFGLPSATGIVANVLAVPVAGLVMLVGLPLALISGLIVDAGFADLAAVIMWPVQVGVRWVWWVAEIFARLKIDGVANIALWIGVFVTILLMRHRSSSV